MAKTWPLEALLTIRDRRYNEALGNKQRKQQLALMAVEKSKRCRQAIEDYKIWKEEEIERRYAAILNTIQTQKTLVDFFQGLSALDIKETQLTEEAQQAEKEELTAKKAMSEAEMQVKHSYEALVKIEKQKELYTAKEKLLEEYRSEIEMEDFHVKKRNAP